MSQKCCREGLPPSHRHKCAYSQRLPHLLCWHDPAAAWNRGTGLNTSLCGWLTTAGTASNHAHPIWRFCVNPLLQVPLCFSSISESLGQTWHNRNSKDVLKTRRPCLIPLWGEPTPGWIRSLRKRWFQVRERSSHLPTASFLPSQVRDRASLHLGPPRMIGKKAWKHSWPLQKHPLSSLFRK